jgi:hypothetical protein
LLNTSTHPPTAFIPIQILEEAPSKMLAKAIFIPALTTCALLLGPVLGMVIPDASNAESHLKAREHHDFVVNFWAQGNCGGKAGPDRGYNSGTCLTLPESSHGVNIKSRRDNCSGTLNLIHT